MWERRAATDDDRAAFQRARRQVEMVWEQQRYALMEVRLPAVQTVAVVELQRSGSVTTHIPL